MGMNIGGGAGASSSGETNALKHVKSKLKEAKPIIFDVGANIGIYSQLLVDHFGENAQIYSFEPSPKAYEKMKANISASNVSMFNLGAGESDSKITLYTNQEGSSHASVYNRTSNPFELKEEIEQRSLDSFCTEKNINKIDFLKIDVEGHEFSVLKGASNLLQEGKINFLQFEFGGNNVNSRTYFQDFYFLLKDNYILYRIVKDGLFKITKYTEISEIFTCTNYLAERIKK